MNEFLTYKRVHPKQITQDKKDELITTAHEIRLKQIKKILPDVKDKEFEIHKLLYSKKFEPTVSFFKSVEKWFNKLVQANRKSNFYLKEESLKEIFVYLWIKVCRVSGKNFLTAFYFFIKSNIPLTIKFRVIFRKINEHIKNRFSQRQKEML